MQTGEKNLSARLYRFQAKSIAYDITRKRELQENTDALSSAKSNLECSFYKLWTFSDRTI